MLESFEYVGAWWLPGDPDDDLSGTLTYSPETGLRLDLIGHFGDRPWLDRSRPIPIINGVASAKEITLHSCTGYSTFSVPGTFRTHIAASTAYTDVHFESEKEMTFNSVWVSLSHLDAWADIWGIEIEEKDRTHYTIRYEPPNPIDAKLQSNDVSLRIGFARFGPQRSVIQTSATIEQRAYVKFELPGQRELADYQSLISQFQNLLSLASTGSSRPTHLHATTEVNRTVSAAGDPIYPPVQVIYRPAVIPSDSDGIVPHEMLFTYREIEDRLEAVLNNWFTEDENIRFVYDMFFASVYGRKSFLENRFLNIVQALESYHRLRVGGTEMPKDKFAALKESLLQAVEDKYKGWVKEKLSFANEKSLLERLKDLAEMHPRLIKAMIGRGSKSFLRRVRDTRNYYIHFSPPLSKKAARGKALYDLTLKLRILFEAVLLESIGFSPDEAADLLSKSRHFPR